MTKLLHSLLVALGLITVDDSRIRVFVPRETTTWAQLRDAGSLDSMEQAVLVCPERLSKKALKRFRGEDGGTGLRPKQRYSDVARVAYCLPNTKPDGGTQKCWRPDGGVGPGLDKGALIVPSWGESQFASNRPETEDDAGDSDSDDSYLVDSQGCRFERCNQHTLFCNKPKNAKLVQPPCAAPNCWVGKRGEWDSTIKADCKRKLSDGGTVFQGCNVICPAEEAVGTECVRVNGVIVAGDPMDLL